MDAHLQDIAQQQARLFREGEVSVLCRRRGGVHSANAIFFSSPEVERSLRGSRQAQSPSKDPDIGIVEHKRLIMKAKNSPSGQSETPPGGQAELVHEISPPGGEIY